MDEIRHICLNCMGNKGENQECPECGHSKDLTVTEPVHLKPGTVLNGKFLIGKVLGHGGFGITYLGWDLILEIKLAIKEYFPQDLVSRTPDYNHVSVYTGDARNHFEHGLKKFMEEAKVLAKFDDHPGIVSVREYFKENQTAYMVMNYVEGMTLQQYVAQKGNVLPWKTALGLMMPVLDALHEIHEAGILHRDISPDNIYITKEGRAKLLDFGAARTASLDQQKSLSVLLRPGYAPEEQYRTKGIQGPWTDIYAAAGTLYRLVTGEVPLEAMERLLDDSLKKPSDMGISLPETFELALMKALAIRSTDRYQNVKEFQSDFKVDLSAVLFTEVDLDIGKENILSSSSETNGKCNDQVESFSSGYNVDDNDNDKIMTEEKSNNEINEPVDGKVTPANQNNIDSARSSDYEKKRSDKQIKAILAVIVILVIIFGALLGNWHDMFNNKSANSDDIDANTTTSSGVVVNEKVVGESPRLAVDYFSSDWAYMTENIDQQDVMSGYRLIRRGVVNGPLRSESVVNDVLDHSTIIVTDTYIFYVNGDDGSALYKVKKDGSNRRKIANGHVSSLNYYDNAIFFQQSFNQFSPGIIHAYSLHNDQLFRISDDLSNLNHVENGWIYYSDENFHLYRMTTAGILKSIVINEEGLVNFFYDGWIYYISFEDNWRLYRIMTDGSGRTKLTDISVWYAFNPEYDGWISYTERDHLGPTDRRFKMLPDGSRNQFVE
ncbi:protein kinase domain-containing protein [Anoxynatronum sibiricum]|uniref:DUF5050 domain-containing protein n=1 Tax=Anoxynatronum sibiricum TaxID=210623 RepID=A0ABU9VX22_9CLOT